MKKAKGKKKVKYNEKQIERMKADSIRLAILYRSLYILKIKFEKYKKEVNKVYDKYYGGEKKHLESYDHRVIKAANFFQLVKEIFEEMKITIPKIINPSDIFYFDIVNFDPNDPSHEESIKLMEKIVLSKNGLEKYNKIYYNRKIKPLVDAFLKNKDNDNVTECYKITEYDRKGRVVHTCDELLEMMGIKGGYKGIRKNPSDEYDRYMKKGDILFIDTLPIIIADFLQVNPDYVVINLDLEDKELINKLKQLYDDDILKRIREEEEKNKKNIKEVPKEPEIEETEDQKKLRELYEKKKKLEKTLQLYQDLLSKKKQNGESYKYILDFIDKIKSELDKINAEIVELLKKMNGNADEKNEILPPLKGKINETDLRMREIFSFYCSQHRAPASYPTFAQISYKVNHMNISEFCKFCTDFKIPLDIDKLMEIYNKREPINENSEINYNEFLMILYKISLFINEGKKRKLMNKINKIKKRMEGGNVSSDSDENDEEIMDDNEKLEKKKNELEHLNKLNFKGAFGELQKYLEIDKPKKYRDKMKGFLMRYHDDQEKIEKYDLLTKEEILKVQEKAEQFKKMREENEKEKANEKERKKKELYEKKKKGFIEQNKKLIKNLKDKEEKKTYMMLKNIKNLKKKEDKKCIINVDKPSEDLKINLDNDDKKLLFIDEEEENSDEEILEKYGVPRKKIIKSEEKKINISNSDEKILEKKEIKNDTENPKDTNTNNDKDKEKDKNENNQENNTNNNLLTNDNISFINTSNTNESKDINELKQNLKPKKKGNIYFSSNNENELKNTETEKEKKEEEDKKEDKKEENKEENKENKEVEIIELKKETNVNNAINDNKKEKTSQKGILKEEEIFLTEPGINKFRKRTIPTKIQSPQKSLTRQIKIKNRIGSNSLEVRKKINIDIISNLNKYKNINKKENQIVNNSLKKGKTNSNRYMDLLSDNRSYDKISIQNNNFNKDIKINGYQNKDKSNKNNKNIITSIKKSTNISRGNNNIIQLPSVNSSNTLFTPTSQNEVNVNESSNIKSAITDNNVIILPEIKNQKNSLDNINKEDSTIENKRYLLFQKNNNKETSSKKALKFNNNVIVLSEEKSKNRGNVQPSNDNKKIKKDNMFNKRTKI